jgi:ribosome-binding protein aMBF1 (putative translation factor)
MENNNRARKHKSAAIERLRRNTPPEVKLAVEAKMTLAAHIADLIEEKGWSKSELARKVDQEPSVITKWLSGTHNFTQDTLAEIAAIFELESVQALYEDREAINEIVDVAIIGEEKQDDGFLVPTGNDRAETNLRVTHIKREKLILRPTGS